MHRPSGSRRRACGGVTAAALAGLVGCNWSDVGNLPNHGPTAQAGMVGQPFTTDSTGNVSTTARSGANVVLSGSESAKGTTPIMDWKWEQTGGPSVALIKRNNAVYSFTAPQVSTNTDLTFKLSVVDANGNLGTATAKVTVTPVQDPNEFLSYLNTNARYQVVARATSATAPNPNAGASQMLGTFKITLSRWITYTTQDTPPQSASLQVGAPTVIQGGWPAALGVSADPADPRNPRFELAVPVLNADDVNVQVQSVNQAKRLELANINAAAVTLCATIDSLSGSPVPALAFLDNTGRVVAPAGTNSVCPAGSVEVPAVKLLARASTNPSVDTPDSATAYYVTIDPNQTRQTLSGWLKTNGWQVSTGAPDFSKADAHVVYTNNFDLGLGRDMYSKVTHCDSPGQLQVGACDVSAVVVNYQGLESAAKKTGPINAVAMEYRRPDGVQGGPRMVTFFAYAPSPSDPNGDFVAVKSVNLDMRGERYLPGSCTVCHGGAPGTMNGTSYGSGPSATLNGDVNAGFLSWDLNSFLYSDTDLSWTKPEDAALRQQLTRTAQEAQFRRMNAAAYLTYSDPAASPNRFKLARELVAGWYSSTATLPASSLDGVLSPSTFNGNFVPPGWMSTNNANPAAGAGVLGSDDVYLKIFAQHCRGCHVQQVPATDPTLAQNCSGAASAPPLDTNQQLPIGCYWSFVHAPKLANMLARGEMPLARRTMDRLWVAAAGGTPTPGALLQAHLASVPSFGPPPPTPGQQPIEDPQTDAKANRFFAYKIDGTPDSRAQTPDVNQLVQLHAQPSFAANYSAIASGYSWSVMRCTSPGVAASCTIPMAVSGSNSSIATFPLAGIAPADYQPTLTITAIDGTTTSATWPIISVPGNPPKFVNPPSSLALAVSSTQSLVGGPGLYLSDLDALGIQWGNGGPAQARVKAALCVPASGTTCNASSDTYLTLSPSVCTQRGCSPLDLAAVNVALQSGVLASPPKGSTLEVTVWDAAQHPAAVQDFPITVQPLGTATPIPEQISANSTQQTFCLATALGTPPANTTFEVVLSASSAQLTPGQLATLTYPVKGSIAPAISAHPGTASVAKCYNTDDYNRAVVYTPPLAVSTATNTGTAYASPDVFYYSIVIRDATSKALLQITNPSTVSFKITQRNSFQDVVTFMSSGASPTCVSCHTTPAIYNNYNATPIVDFTASAATLCGLLASGGTQGAYTYPVDHSPFADINDALNPSTLNSGLLCFPTLTCKDPNNGTMPQSYNLSSLSAIRTWIEDGKSCH